MPTLAQHADRIQSTCKWDSDRQLVFVRFWLIVLQFLILFFCWPPNNLFLFTHMVNEGGINTWRWLWQSCFVIVFFVCLRPRNAPTTLSMTTGQRRPPSISQPGAGPPFINTPAGNSSVLAFFCLIVFVGCFLLLNKGDSTYVWDFPRPFSVFMYSQMDIPAGWGQK